VEYQQHSYEPPPSPTPVNIKRERGGKVTGPLLPSVPMEVFDTYRLELQSKNGGTAYHCQPHFPE